MKNITRESIIEAAKEAAKQVSDPLSRADFVRITGISKDQIYTKFPEGGWSEIRELAGLGHNPKHNLPISDDNLLKEYHRVISILEYIPTWVVFNDKANISADVISRRFGGSKVTVRRYIDWLKNNHPDSPLLNEIKITENLPAKVKELSTSKVSSECGKVDGPIYGAPIDFRGLRHAPINEQGVVFLFGVVSYELRFIVEAVHASYPDCEAKRCIDRNRNRWQRVRIEFEYKSSNFKDHGHNPQECDLIVCWEHDWVDCPIEVIELRKVIKELPKEVRYA
jgi:hypothetical protein